MDQQGYGTNLAFMRRLLLGLVGVIALGACGDDRTPSPAAGAAQSTPPVAATVAVQATPPVAATAGQPTAVAVPEALSFTAPLVGGGTLSLADYAGTPVLLWFWAPT
jgi:hypothetical protein